MTEMRSDSRQRGRDALPGSHPAEAQRTGWTPRARTVRSSVDQVDWSSSDSSAAPLAGRVLDHRRPVPRRVARLRGNQRSDCHLSTGEAWPQGTTGRPHPPSRSRPPRRHRLDPPCVRYALAPGRGPRAPGQDHRRGPGGLDHSDPRDERRAWRGRPGSLVNPPRSSGMPKRPRALRPG